MKVLFLFVVLCLAASQALPKDCAEAYAADPNNAHDGYYTVDIDGDSPRLPFQVWCQEMSEQGRKLMYIELANTKGKTGNDVNTGTLRGADLNGVLTTYFERLLVDFVDQNFRLNIFTDSLAGIGGAGPRVSEPKDYTFSTTVIVPQGAQLNFAGGIWSTPVGWGTSKLCSPPNLPPAALIDLTGTPFTISTATTFSAFGSSPYGSFFVSPDRKHASIQGAGNCGGGGDATKYVKLEAATCAEQWQCTGVSNDYNFVACTGQCTCRASQGFQGAATESDKCRCSGAGQSVHYFNGLAYCVSPGQCIGLSAGNYHCSSVSEHYSFVECVDDTGSLDKCQCKSGFTGAATEADKCRCTGTLTWVDNNPVCTN